MFYFLLFIIIPILSTYMHGISELCEGKIKYVLYNDQYNIIYCVWIDVNDLLNFYSFGWFGS